jgi:hypothetical protein
MDTTANAFELLSDGRALELHAAGKLTTGFYRQLVPTVERQIEEFGKLRIVLVLKDFHGCAAGALWSDVDLKRTGGLTDFVTIPDFLKVRAGRNGGGDLWHTDGAPDVGTLTLHKT